MTPHKKKLIVCILFAIPALLRFILPIDFGFADWVFTTWYGIIFYVVAFLLVVRAAGRHF